MCIMDSHQGGRRIARMQRHLADKPRVHVGERRVDGVVAGVGFGRGGDGERRFGKTSEQVAQQATG